MKCLVSVFCLFYYIKVSRCSSSEGLITYDDSEDNNEELRKYDFSYNEAPIDSYELDHDSMTILKNQRLKKHQNDQYSIEKKAGDIRDLFGTNVHHRQPNTYNDLGRRSMTNNVGYSSGFQKRWNKKGTKEDRLTPVKASPELVLAVAKASAKNQAAKPTVDTEESVKKKILRTGDYWNSVWVENIDDPDNALRTRKDDLGPKLATVKTKIMPGSELYRLISVLRQISPRLIYVMNTAPEK